MWARFRVQNKAVLLAPSLVSTRRSTSEVDAEVEASKKAPASALPDGFSVQVYSGNVEGAKCEWAASTVTGKESDYWK
jgi:hypothetical protein